MTVLSGLRFTPKPAGDLSGRGGVVGRLASGLESVGHGDFESCEQQGELSVEVLIDATFPYSFSIYYREDVHPVMTNAGDTTDCVAYLMGNHVIAETMFRHDPRAMLHAPLRTLIWEDPERPAWFTADQPSTQFASLGIPEIQAVGEDHHGRPGGALGYEFSDSLEWEIGYRFLVGVLGGSDSRSGNVQPANAERR